MGKLKDKVYGVLTILVVFSGTIIIITLLVMAIMADLGWRW